MVSVDTMQAANAGALTRERAVGEELTVRPTASPIRRKTVPFRSQVAMLHRIMMTPIESLRSLVRTDRFERLLAIGWEETGAIILAAMAIGVIGAVQLIRSR
jgi:hypothetical protein